MKQPNAFTRLASALAGLASALLLAASPPAAAADVPGLGVTVLAAQGEDEALTVYYPSSSPAAPVQHGFYRLTAATDGTPLRGNGHLVLISHGTGGSGMVHTDLARALVTAGFTVATPLHRGDNWRDHRVGTFDSPKLRPHEISRAIDRVAADPRFAPLLDLQRGGRLRHERRRLHRADPGRRALVAAAVREALRREPGRGLAVLHRRVHVAHRRLAGRPEAMGGAQGNPPPLRRRHHDLRPHRPARCRRGGRGAGCRRLRPAKPGTAEGAAGPGDQWAPTAG